MLSAKNDDFPESEKEKQNYAGNETTPHINNGKGLLTRSHFGTRCRKNFPTQQHKENRKIYGHHEKCRLDPKLAPDES
jgi:hypothetical protein